MDSCDYFVRTSLRVGFLFEIVVGTFDVYRFRDQSLRLRLKIQRNLEKDMVCGTPQMIKSCDNLKQ